MFAVTAGGGLDALVADYDRQNDIYKSIMAKALADRLAEAFAEYLTFIVKYGPSIGAISPMSSWITNNSFASVTRESDQLPDTPLIRITDKRKSFGT